MEDSREPSLAVGSEVTMKKKVSPGATCMLCAGKYSKPARKSVKAPTLLGAVLHHSEHVGYRCSAPYAGSGSQSAACERRAKDSI